MRYCKDQRVAITDLRVISRSDNEHPNYVAVLSLRPSRRLNRELLLTHIRNVHGVQEVEES